MNYCPDVYDQWCRHEAEQQKRLKEFPVCGYCDEPIQDTFYYEIEGETICEDCLKTHFRKRVEI